MKKYSCVVFHSLISFQFIVEWKTISWWDRKKADINTALVFWEQFTKQFLTYGLIEGRKLWIIITLFWANRKAKFSVYCWLCAHAMLGVTCFPAFFRSIRSHFKRSVDCSWPRPQEELPDPQSQGGGRVLPRHGQLRGHTGQVLCAGGTVYNETFCYLVYVFWR